MNRLRTWLGVHIRAGLAVLLLALALLTLALTLVVPTRAHARQEPDAPAGSTSTLTAPLSDGPSDDAVPVDAEAEPVTVPDVGLPTVLGAEPSIEGLPAIELLRPLTVPELLADAARRWGMTPAQARQFDCIARRESGYNPLAVGPWTRWGTAKGVMQFIDPTWATASRAVGLAGASVFDPAVNVEAAAWLYLHVGPAQWESVVPLHWC